MSGFVSCSKVVLLNWDAANFSAGMPYQITILNKCHNSSVLLFSLVLLSHCGALLFLYNIVFASILFIYLFVLHNSQWFFPPPHVLSDFVVPLRLWLKCNRLLRLGRPVGAVTLSR